MSEWKEVTLDDVAIINPTESLKKGQLAKKIAMESLQPFTKNPSSFSWEEFNGGMKFRNGDTLVARITPCLENGKTSYIDILNEGEIGFGSTEYIVLREKPQISDKQFLYYFCISPIFRDVAILSMTGSSGRQRVQTDVVRQHLFELPPIKEQKAIASVLSSLDDKIDLLHRQNKTLEAMAETLFRQWFVEEAEESSNTIFLGDIAYFSNGKSRPEEVPNGSVPIYGGNGILGYTNQSNSNGPSIIIGRVGAYCGSLFIENKPVWISDNAMLAKPINDSSHSYLFYLLKSLRLNEFAEGSSHPLLTQALLNSIQIISPSAEKISLFCHEADKWKEKSDFNQLQIKTLETLRDTLLPKLMSGEVRVDYP